MTIDDVKALHTLIGQLEVFQREYDKVAENTAGFRVYYNNGHDYTDVTDPEDIRVLRDALRGLRAEKVMNVKNELRKMGVDV